MKRWVCFLVSTFMAFSCCGMNVFAVDEEQKGETVVQTTSNEQQDPVMDGTTTVDSETVNDDSTTDGESEKVTETSSMEETVTTPENGEGTDGEVDTETEPEGEATDGALSDGETDQTNSSETGEVVEPPVEESEEVSVDTFEVQTTAVNAINSGIALMSLEPTEMVYDLDVLSPNREDNTIDLFDGDGCGPDNPHVITGTTEEKGYWDGIIRRTDDPISINVNSGVHYVELDEATMIENSDSGSAIDVLSGTELHLIVSSRNGSSRLTGEGASHPAIWVDNDAKLFIEGDGTLTAAGGGIGIGGEGTGSITIDMTGTLNANGDTNKTGLEAKSINILNGNVNVTGENNNAIQAETVNISGGNVTASISSGSGTGITANELVIESGNVKATGSNGGEGIDSKVTRIDGGTVTANGSGTTDFDTAAGIHVGPGSTLIINDGDITANGGSGATNLSGAAGIGGNGGEAFGDIVINGGTVTSTGGTGAAAIGTGYDTGGSLGGTITVNDGVVKALATPNWAGAAGAGIGSGANVDFTGTINLYGGLIYAEGSGSVTDSEYAASFGSGSSLFNTPGNCVINIGNDAGGDGFVTVVAPNGITSTSNMDSWNGILVNQTYLDDLVSNNTHVQDGISQNSVTYDNGVFTFQEGVQANVIGTVSVKEGSAIVINDNAEITVRNEGRFLTGDYAQELSKDAVLIFEDGANTGGILSGDGTGKISVNGELHLLHGRDQVEGDGTLSVVDDQDKEGVLKIRLTNDLISSAWNLNDQNVYTHPYDGTTFKDSLSVQLKDLWGFNWTFKEGSDYDYTTSNLEHNTPQYQSPYYYEGSVIASKQANSWLLYDGTTVSLKYQIEANYDWNVPESFTISKVAHEWMKDLPTVGYDQSSTNNKIYPIITIPQEPNPDTSTVPYQGTLEWFVNEECTIALDDPYISSFISNNKDANELKVYWKYTPANNDQKVYTPYVIGSLNLNLVDERVLNLFITEGNQTVDTVTKVYGETFALGVIGRFTDDQSQVNLHDVSWKIERNVGNNQWVEDNQYVILKNGQNTTSPKFEVVYLPTDSNVVLRIVASVPTHIDIDGDPTGLDNHAAASATVTVQLSPKELKVIDSDPVTKYYDPNDLTVDGTKASFTLDETGLINGDQLDLSWTVDDLQQGYAINTDHEVNAHFTVSDVDGVTQPVAHCYTLVNVPTLTVHVVSKPISPSKDSGDTTVSTWDDGGPFTTDACGSVYDRWGNLIYQGVCGVTNSGYQLVATNDQ